jgi:hypothetical protein
MLIVQDFKLKKKTKIKIKKIGVELQAFQCLSRPQ